MVTVRRARSRGRTAQRALPVTVGGNSLSDELRAPDAGRFLWARLWRGRERRENMSTRRGAVFVNRSLTVTVLNTAPLPADALGASWPSQTVTARLDGMRSRRVARYNRFLWASVRFDSRSLTVTVLNTAPLSADALVASWRRQTVTARLDGMRSHRVARYNRFLWASVRFDSRSLTVTVLNTALLCPLTRWLPPGGAKRSRLGWTECAPYVARHNRSLWSRLVRVLIFRPFLRCGVESTALCSRITSSRSQMYGQDVDALASPADALVGAWPKPNGRASLMALAFERS